jgi:hypothetical protein
MNNYEKKYKDALSWMQSLYDGLHGATKKDAEHYFPELKESEDERTKRILNSISNKMSFHLRDIFTDEEFQCFDAWSNAWLEKQEEQKQETNYPKFTFNDVLALQCCMETVEKVQEDKELYEQLQSLHSRLYDASQLKKIEQKSFWSEEDEDNMLMIEDKLRDFLDYIKKDSTLKKHIKNSLKEEIIENIDWLKSLKDRVSCEVNCTTTKEWSEEDAEMKAR